MTRSPKWGLRYPKKSRPVETGYVYFCQVDGGGPIKIGWAKDVYRRLQSLQTYCPYRLRSLAVLPGTIQDETQHLKRFSEYHIRGEWFRPEAELVEYIATLSPPKMALTAHEYAAEILERPSTTTAWTSSDHLTDADAAEFIGLPTWLLRQVLGLSGRKRGASGAVARRIGAAGGAAKGISSAAKREQVWPTELVMEILDRPGMTYDKAAELLGGAPFSATTLRRHYKRAA